MSVSCAVADLDRALAFYRDGLGFRTAQARAARAAVTDSPHDRPWGIYSGYFQDPDGHLWEIIWNPALDLASS